jgi:hypothetical protein
MTEHDAADDIIQSLIDENAAESRAPLTDSTGKVIKLDALAVDSLPDQVFTAHDDTDQVQTTLGSIEHIDE